MIGFTEKTSEIKTVEFGHIVFVSSSETEEKEASKFYPKISYRLVKKYYLAYIFLLTRQSNHPCVTMNVPRQCRHHLPRNHRLLFHQIFLVVCHLLFHRLDCPRIQVPFYR